MLYHFKLKEQVSLLNMFRLCIRKLKHIFYKMVSSKCADYMYKYIQGEWLSFGSKDCTKEPTCKVWKLSGPE